MSFHINRKEIMLNFIIIIIVDKLVSKIIEFQDFKAFLDN